MPKALKYSFAAIAIYLAVAYASGSAKVLSSGATGGSSLIKAFQGR